MNRKFILHKANATTRCALLLSLAAGTALTACSVVRQPHEPPAAPEIAHAPVFAAPALPGPAPDAEPILGRESPARTMDAYKEEVARWIYTRSAQNIFEGVPPPMLKSVVVLAVAIDAHGQPRRVAILRSNGHSALNQLAVQSVKSATPLPRPGRALLRGGAAEFTETWLFRDDGRFQIRSLALAQSSIDD